MGRIVVLATKNADKAREMAALFAGLPVERVVRATDLGDVPDVVEDGDTLYANALKKAREIAAHTGEMCIADDTGLEVDALDGAPGIYAARYAGPDASYDDNCAKLMHELNGVPAERRTARFRTVMAVVDPRVEGSAQTVDGVLEGIILDERRGDGGFGYDPLFFVPSHACTLAEMDPAEKNRISHRARASQAMVELLERTLQRNDG